MKPAQFPEHQPVHPLSEALERIRLGISWPPEPWQRVEITGNRLPGDPDGPLLGTVLSRDGSYTLVLPDHYLSLPHIDFRECYWDNELQPMPTKEPGWVPLPLYKVFLIDWTKPAALDLKLNDGKRAFNCWPKKMPPDFYTFNEMDKPHGRYTEHHVAAVRPAEV
jgi:hypothetical protein